MNKLKLKALTQEYSGRCKIIPCCDLPKIESNFDDLKDDIIDAFKDQRIICNWSLKDGVLEKYKDKDFDNEDEETEYLWLELICKCMNDGFLIIYESPVPRNIRMENGKVQSYSCSWGYTQTNYIHLNDITQLSAVLSNLDDELIRKEYKEENDE